MKKLILILCLGTFLSARADEGMWLPGNLNAKTRLLLKELGLQIPDSLLYSNNQPSLKDAVVSFGGFCSGVVVSQEGLVFTNHHCGFDAIQQHSTVEHDYLKDGFTAHSREEELPNPDLYVSFLIRTENVTKRILDAVTEETDENRRRTAIDSLCLTIQDEVSEKDSMLRGVVDAYYEGNEYYLSVYKDYYDIRLVFAPPSSVGKFGGDTDNWVWPRHTGDFSVFRIYAGKDNEPAPYHPDNQPYKPVYSAPVSLEGYQEGSFCMTLGYPGTTERYRSSFGITERTQAINRALIDIRGIKQTLWKKAMEQNDSVRIRYAAKYATSANYWKNSIGMNRAVEELRVLENKQALEQDLRQWVRQKPEERNRYLRVLTDLELDYRNRFDAMRATAYLGEAFFNAPELVSVAYHILNFDFSDDSTQVARKVRELTDQYEDIDLNTDKKVFSAMLEAYKKKVDPEFLPDFYQTIGKDYKGDYNRYVDDLYTHSGLSTPEGFKKAMENDSTYRFIEDPVTQFVLDLIVKYYDLGQSMDKTGRNIDRNERLLNAAVREMNEGIPDPYPDANSTLRLSFGIISGYSPANAVNYRHFTTTKGIFEKVSRYKGDRDFEVQPVLLDFLSQKEFGKYATPSGEMNVCFISDNDITGGNSGSGMFNGRGQLIGLAFDGNWEAMSSDFRYEPRLQRCIGVDVRYMLFLIEKYAKAGHLIRELNLY